MSRDRVVGWKPIERISVLVLVSWRPVRIRATRWLAPTGTEATLIQSVGAAAEVPVVASGPAVAHDAGLAPGSWVLDPQICWHDIDARHLVVSPVLELRLSMRGFRDAGASTLGPQRSVRAVRVDSLTGSRRPMSPAATYRAPRPGTYLGVATRWPMPRVSPEPVTPPTARTTRLAAGPAAFLREDRDDPVPI